MTSGIGSDDIPEADAAEQRLPAAPDATDPGGPDLLDLGDVDPSDALDQLRDAGQDDEDESIGRG